MRRFLLATAALGAAWVFAAPQTGDLGILRKSGEIPTIAVPDLRGVAQAQGFMPAFNQTLWDDLNGSGYLKMASKSYYPKFVPQQPADFTQPPPVVPESAPKKRGARPAPAIVTPTNGGGHWLSDWSSPPVQANYLAFGYTAVQNNVLVLYGWLYDLRNPQQPQAIAKRYNGSPDQAGATKVAHDFAADILALFGATSLAGTHIYFVSDRTGSKEIWAMDFDGKNQHALTHYNSLSIQPAVSPDGSRIAFTSYARGNPGIFVGSVDPSFRDLRFYNQRASVNSSPSFTPDGKQIIYSSSAPNDRCCRIFLANLDGTGFRPITAYGALDTEPKINPKTGGEMVFASSRSGPEQIYRANLDGTDMERITDGTGEAGNPSWHPDGQFLAFSWTRGFAAGAWNVFVMDIGSHRYNQLTHGEGRNENPSWAPDGKHIVFGSTRHGRSQIFSMLADGTQVQQLTTQGSNERPVWGK
jgi:TolB protein